MKKDNIILGIDPGTTIMGFGIIHIIDKKITVLAIDIIDLHKVVDHFTKLKIIFERTVQLIDTYKPDELAIESQFFGKNVQSMLKLGRAQGVAIAAALSRTIPVYEYAPKKIKMSITGNGNASKEQVAAMLQKILHIEDITKKLDATDGLAAAICHHFQKNTALPQSSSSKSWKDFISKNPEKVKK